MGKKLPTQTYHDTGEKKVDPEIIRQKLKLKHLEVKKSFSEKHPHVERFFRDKGLDLGKIREHSAKLLGAGAMAGALLLNPQFTTKALPSPFEIIEKLKLKTPGLVKGETMEQEIPDPKKFLVDTLESTLPEKSRPLSRSEEKFLEAIFQNVSGISARATLEGEHLNTTYGFIGAEQHLRRYPGDSLNQHGKGEILIQGMAPGLSAWGYFADSYQKLSSDLEEIERWYAVVQTLYLPDWNKRQPYLKNWYKYRKVLIVNTQNGNAVVASIADSGPAAWTGKHYGGSPEVMTTLGGPKYRKGPVIVFFVDDPYNKVPLGPVEY